MLTAQMRRVLLALVLLNLVFVQITGSVNLTWMLPLFALTVAAPYLWNLQRWLVYRTVWNAALIGIFAVLLVDVRHSGIRFLLEDGLILAAFCQVHVLNNLLKQKRPDLIFFNSFLIALVTGFFCQDVVYSIVFVIYALLLVFALSLAAASTVDGIPSRTLTRPEFRCLIQRSARHGLVVMILTGLAFTFWPRDFEREGFVEDRLASSAAAAEVAFADQIRFNRKGNTVLTNRIVLRAKLLNGNRGAVSRYWRGATFTMLHRYGWTADTNPQRFAGRRRQLDEPWKRRTAREFIRPGHRLGAALEVELEEPQALNLFLPAASHRIQFDCRAFPNVDGNFRISHTAGSKVRYLLELNAVDDPPKKGEGRPTAEHRQLRARAIPKGSRALDAQVKKLLRRGMTRREKVEAVRRFLSNTHTYALPGEPDAAGNLQEFLAGNGGGHCEYFATAMVVLLRLHDIPCRMVSGYLAHEWNDEGTALIVRSKDAHAWVEVWDEEQGWFAVDPTPSMDANGDGNASLLASTGRFFRRAWAAVTSFDSASRDAALAWAKERVVGLFTLATRHPSGVLAALLVGLGLRRWLRRRRAARIDSGVRDYVGVLARLRLELRPGETPRQLLARAAREGLPDATLTPLAAATQRHERVRYGVTDGVTDGPGTARSGSRTATW